jgi:nitrite reductase (NO-forming)
VNAAPPLASTGPPATAARAPRGPAGRVAVAQHQARLTLGTAGVFAVAAAAALVVPHRTGWWLPLHLFLVGALLLAISAATPLFTVTWAAGPPPTDAYATTQRIALAVGALALAVGREADVTPLLAIGGSLVVGALVMLAVSLRRTMVGAVQRRFDSAVRCYLAAIAFGVAGCLLGLVMGLDETGDVHDRVRTAHLTLNLLGLVGLVIVGTLPLFIATQLRAKASRHATPPVLSALLAGFVLALGLAGAGALTGFAAITAAGYTVYAALLSGLVLLVPPVGRKQLAWAGPRVLQLAAGVAWWCGATAVMAVHAAAGSNVFTPAVIAALVVGGYAQILVASLAYLGPVLRGGGHERLAAGFRLTRAWPGLVAANVAATALVLDVPVAAAALAIWVIDTLVRAVLLLRPAPPSGSVASRLVS